MSKANRLVTRSLFAATFLNFLLATLKISAGLWGDSLSLVGDGIDSGTDVVAGIFSFFAVRLVAKPATHSFAYGYSRAETMATWLAGSLIFVIAVQLLTQSISFLLDSQSAEIPKAFTVYIVGISIASKLCLSIGLFWVYRKSKNALIRATAKNMRADVLLSLSVLFGIAASLYTSTRLYDALFALLIGLWILKDAYEIFKESFVELMDGLQDPSLYKRLSEAVLSVDPSLNPHRMRIRKMAQNLIISLDIEVEGTLSVLEGHRIAQKVEGSIKSCLEDVYDVLVHVEPHGNLEPEEYGVSHTHLQG